MDTLKRAEGGEGKAALARRHILGERTIGNMKSKADEMCGTDLPSKVATTVTSPIIERMETMPNLYTEHENNKNQAVTKCSVREKAPSI